MASKRLHTVDELPQFTVESCDRGVAVGQFHPSPWIGEGWIGCLFLSVRWIWGRFTQLDRERKVCTFTFDSPEDASQVTIGEVYPYLDSYWGERAEIVLDRTLVWHRQHFTPRPAARVVLPSGGMAMTPNEPFPAGSEVVADGWDHEHCAISGETIGAGGQLDAFTASQDIWVCESCYESFVKPRSLAFIEWPNRPIQTDALRNARG
jgi:hypothetical protein